MVAFMEVTEQLQRLDLHNKSPANAQHLSESMPERSVMSDNATSTLSSSASATCYLETSTWDADGGQNSTQEVCFHIGSSWEKESQRHHSFPSMSGLRPSRSFKQCSSLKYRRKKPVVSLTSQVVASEAWSLESVCLTPELICFGKWAAESEAGSSHHDHASGACDNGKRQCLVCQRRPKSQPCLLPGKYSLGKRCRGEESPRPNINFAKMTKSSSLRNLGECSYVLTPADALSSPSDQPSPVNFATPIDTAHSQPPVDLDIEAIERD